MAHTPGRWKRAGTSVLTQDGGLVASVYDGSDYSAEACGERQHKHKTAAANAQLIEAAPDMLEALQGVQKWYGQLPYHVRAAIISASSALPGTIGALAACDAAIAKAEGLA
ncbi:MAG: hypothetical protein KGR25_00015 [Chloroflexi bacterium]|nr:hypothetical protein [Chloroflexota bacterium]